MTERAFVNVVVPFDERYARDVDELIATMVNDKIGNRPNDDIVERIAAMAVVHFLSITVIGRHCPGDEKDVQPSSQRAHLFIEMSVDGGTKRALALLAEKLEPELRQLLGAARVDPGPDPSALRAFLLRHHLVIVDTWSGTTLGQIFTGSPAQGVERICKERALARQVGELIDTNRKDERWVHQTARQRLDFIRTLLWREGNLKWAFVPEAAPCLGPAPNDAYKLSNPQARKAIRAILRKLIGPHVTILAIVAVLTIAHFATAYWWGEFLIWMLVLALVVSVVMIILVLLAGAWSALKYLQYLEKRDRAENVTPPARQVAVLERVENFGAQNHLASASPLKRPYWFRKLTLRLAFVVVGTGPYVSRPGFLGKNGVIHFARWMLLPGTTQLLFWSNYTGTWASYVGDFIADAPSGVTAIWSNCVGFPKTARLFEEGANHRDQLIRWARRQQHPTRLWYSAYPDLTAERIRINAAIRQGIASADSDADAEDWLALFGSVPSPPDLLQKTEIPTLLFGGLSHLPLSVCHLLAFNGSKAQSTKWLERAGRTTTYGPTLPSQAVAVTIALSATGLEKLGLPDEAIGTFPAAFQQGMWPEWRARALADEGKNAPAEWAWGGPEQKRVAAVVVVHARNENELEKVKTEIFADRVDCGIEFIREIGTVPLPTKPRKGDTGQPTNAAPDNAEPSTHNVNSSAAPPRHPTEPFGFADGISQPIIRGTPRWFAYRDSDHLVEPGEFILGYPDNLKELPPSPSLAGEYDPRRFLPDQGPDPIRNRPEFSRYQGNGQRDIGANGTFLVVRELEQDVDTFNAWLEKTAAWMIANEGLVVIKDADTEEIAILSGYPPEADPEAYKSPRDLSNVFATSGGPGGNRKVQVSPAALKDLPLIKEAIAAKLIGRWKNGTSLVRHPHAPGTGPNGTKPVEADNTFRFGEEDPRGIRCPFGAHIRRANPRDMRFPGKKAEILDTNRHRILRVGRAYDFHEKDEKGERHHRRGLLFMCFNANIERQFEFIQKTWLMNPNIHGLEDELDPMMGLNKRDDAGQPLSRQLTLQTPTGPARLKVTEDFVKVRGGAYFFVPGRAFLRYLMRDDRPPPAMEEKAIAAAGK